MKALLINPWIADFAAYNFWIRPLGLYSLASWLYSLGIEIALIDCLSPFGAPGKFRRKKVPFPLDDNCLSMDRSYAKYGISRQEFRQRLKNIQDYDVVFITSVMSYWYPGIIWVIEEIKKHSPSVPIVLGGIYATLWPKHAQEKLEIDLLCEGPLEANKKKIKSFLGITKRIRPLLPWYDIVAWDGVNYGAVRTAIGCPFSCTYCASRILTGGFRPLERNGVIKEILFYYSKGVRQIAFYDDALLVDFENRLRPILMDLKKKGLNLEFHTPNGLHARLINEEVAKWLVASNFKTIRLSLESVSEARQQATGGKVSNKDLVQAVKNLLSAGMNPKYIGVYLLVGLPGQELEEVEAGIKFVKSLGIRPYLAEFSPIPQTVEWEHLEKKGIVSINMDPILTNNTIFFRLFGNYDMEQFSILKKMARE